MSKSKKTRFFATIDGADRLLFSVQKSFGGSITITSRTPAALVTFETPGKYGFSDGVRKAYEEQHYSGHESNDGIATTITQKTTFQGEHQSNAAYVPNTKDYLLWPVFWRRYPIFDSDVNLLVRKSRDTYVQLAEFSYKTASLLYGVFVARPTFDLTALTDAGVEIKTAVFENHRVIAIPYFINLPSLPTGDVLGMTISSTVINGIKSPDHFSDFGPSYTTRKTRRIKSFVHGETTKHIPAKDAARLRGVRFRSVPYSVGTIATYPKTFSQ